MYEIIFDKKAVENLNKIEYKTKERIFKKIISTKEKPFRYFERLAQSCGNETNGVLIPYPHTVTAIGRGRFIISLWSYYGYLLVDCRRKTVNYKMMDDNDENHVYGSKQWYDADTNSIYYMTYSIKDSFEKTLNPFETVFSRILSCELTTGKTEEVWSGNFSDYMHDLVISKDKRYLVVCDMGRFLDKDNKLIPSRLLVLDLHNKNEWLIRDIPNAAHVFFDPDDQEVIYFSNHNFRFEHTPFFELIKKGSYTINFFGPASVHKYRVTPDGPKAIGVFSHPDLYRMTNCHIFRSEGRKILAAFGAPNYIFIADPEKMEFIRKIEINNPDTPCYIGTFSPSPDGNKLYIQTTRSFQVANISDGTPEMVRSLEFNHTCSNHMELSNDTDW